jgi:hypothetical protein
MLGVLDLDDRALQTEIPGHDYLHLIARKIVAPDEEDDASMVCIKEQDRVRGLGICCSARQVHARDTACAVSLHPSLERVAFVRTGSERAFSDTVREYTKADPITDDRERCKRNDDRLKLERDHPDQYEDCKSRHDRESDTLLE